MTQLRNHLGQYRKRTLVENHRQHPQAYVSSPGTALALLESIYIAVLFALLGFVIGSIAISLLSL